SAKGGRTEASEWAAKRRSRRPEAKCVQGTLPCVLAVGKQTSGPPEASDRAGERPCRPDRVWKRCGMNLAVQRLNCGTRCSRRKVDNYPLERPGVKLAINRSPLRPRRATASR